MTCRLSSSLSALLTLAALLPAAAFAHGGHDHAAAPTAPAAGAAPRSAGWTQAPILLVGRNRDGDRTQATVRPQGLTPAQVELYGPGAISEAKRLPLNAGSAELAPTTPGKGNYHLLTASEERDGVIRRASTAWYVSNPGPAPTAMLAQPRPGLEVLPAPLPREHAAFREGMAWRFQARHNGQPLAGLTLRLETEGGSLTQAVTDADGLAPLQFPRDFTPERLNGGNGHNARPSLRFVVSGEWSDGGGQRYLSAFNGSYNPDPLRQRDTALGAGFLVLGMVLATPLLRRRNTAAATPENNHD